MNMKNYKRNVMGVMICSLLIFGFVIIAGVSNNRSVKGLVSVLALALGITGVVFGSFIVKSESGAAKTAAILTFIPFTALFAGIPGIIALATAKPVASDENQTQMNPELEVQNDF